MSKPRQVKDFSMIHPLILASSSRYRATLLQRLQLPFTTQAPELDETPLPGESAGQLVMRLSVAKAKAIAVQHPGHWVLGSDQCAALGSALLGKPGHHAAAAAQLAQLSGRTVEFHTGVALVRGETVLSAQDLTRVRFRTLLREEIERYLQAEPAYDCAGSFKCEGLGISLLEAMESTDPTALIGLPLIAVRRLLAQAEIAIP